VPRGLRDLVTGIRHIRGTPGTTLADGAVNFGELRRAAVKNYRAIEGAAKNLHGVLPLAVEL
jgi:hypothetical protein